MKIHCIQHVRFEVPGTINEWIEEKNHLLSTTHAYESENFPETGSFDLLLVMGGPMNIYEYDKYPWLKEEKISGKSRFGRKAVLGICLGAQAACRCPQGKVFKNDYKEIGWFPVSVVKDGKSELSILEGMPEKFTAFHWHGDTFGLPEGQSGSLKAKPVKIRVHYGDRVIGLQFHLEMSEQSIRNVIENCRDEFVEGNTSREKTKCWTEKVLTESKKLMFRLMDNIEKAIML